MRSRSILSLLLLALVPLALAGVVRAQEFPSRPIKMVVPFPPGGGADATARQFAQRMGDALGQPVVVENKAGANGSIGTGSVAKAAADGYTLLYTDRGALGINPSLYKNLPYDPAKDFAYVGIAVWSPYVLVASPQAPFADFAGFVAFAKKAPCKINYASFGIGSMAQMGMESLNTRFGICTTHVPYKGGGPALMATLAHEVDVTIATIGPALGAIHERRLTGLAVGAENRSPLLPDVPSIVQVGGAADTIPQTFFGFALPEGTPPAIVNKFSTTIQRILSSPDMKEWLAAAGFEPAEVSPEGMQRTVVTDIAQFAALAKKLGIRRE